MSVWLFVAFAVAVVGTVAFVILWRRDSPPKQRPVLRRKKARKLDKIIDGIAERGELNSAAIAGELALIKELTSTVAELTKDIHAHIVGRSETHQ